MRFAKEERTDCALSSSPSIKEEAIIFCSKVSKAVSRFVSLFTAPVFPSKIPCFKRTSLNKGEMAVFCHLKLGQSGFCHIHVILLLIIIVSYLSQLTILFGSLHDSNNSDIWLTN